MKKKSYMYEYNRKKMFCKSKGKKSLSCKKKLRYCMLHLCVKSKKGKLSTTKNTGWLPKLGVGGEEMGIYWSKGTNFWLQ